MKEEDNHWFDETIAKGNSSGMYKLALADALKKLESAKSSLEFFTEHFDETTRKIAKNALEKIK